MTSSALMSLSSGFEVVASGMGVGSCVVEAVMVVTWEFSGAVEEACVGSVDTDGAVVVTSGTSEEATGRSVASASGKMSSSSCISPTPIASSSGSMAVGGYSVWGSDVGGGWLETWSTSAVGRGRVVPELVGSRSSGGGQT